MDYRQAAALLHTKDQVLILTHRRPDGDTIGSGAALCRALRDDGKIAYLSPNKEAHGLFAPYLEGLVAPVGFQPHFIVAVDTASWELVPDDAQALYDGKVDLCIDHHGSNTYFAKESCVAPQYAACGELLYLIIKALVPITAEIALLLYVAISTDTGCFMFSNTTAMTHRITAELMEIGFDHHWVNKRHFRTKSLRRVYLEGQMVQNMLILHEGKTAIAAIPLSMMQAIDATEEDVDNISAFLEQIEGVETAVTIRELRPGECKLSVRTGNNLNASTVCALLGGGGHPSAAGCTISGSAEAAQAAILASIEQVQLTMA